MTTSKRIVDAVGLRKVYKDFWGRVKAIGVDDLNIGVKQGEVFGLLGPNGSGKTTVIKLILGLLKPTSGVIRVFDRDPSDINIKRRVGYLPEHTHLYPYLTAEELLEFFGSLFKIPSPVRSKRTKELLEMVGLAHSGKRRVGEFSKGMARRIGLAQALINDPDLIILDEPASGLDPMGRHDVKNLIRSLSQRNKTVIISSHLLADMEEVCDTLLFIYGGKLQALGSVTDLLTMHDKIQITMDSSNRGIIKQITEICESSVSKNSITIDHPAIRLEEFFARVIKSAKKTGVGSDGVNSERQIAGFLTPNDAEKRSSEQILSEWNNERSRPARSSLDQTVSEVNLDNLEALRGRTENEYANDRNKTD